VKKENTKRRGKFSKRRGNFSKRRGNFSKRRGNFSKRRGNFSKRKGGKLSKRGNTKRKLMHGAARPPLPDTRSWFPWMDSYWHASPAEIQAEAAAAKASWKTQNDALRAARLAREAREARAAQAARDAEVAAAEENR